MRGSKADIIESLQKEILPLEGYKPVMTNVLPAIDLGPVNASFPNKTFPLGAVHEFLYDSAEDAAATSGFIAAMLGFVMKYNGMVICVSKQQQLFPPSLSRFGINASNIIFIEVKKEKELLWVIEESLKCNGLCAVIAEANELNLTTSRRLQLAVEKSGVTGMIVRNTAFIKNITSNSCITRWKISSLPSINDDELPGVGFPQWQVNLEKVRNGKPGIWNLQFRSGKFMEVGVEEELLTFEEWKKKTG